MVKRWLIFILIIMGILTPAFFIKKKPSTPPSLNVQNWQDELKTGDLLLWANSSMDSLVVQELTDGLYSHTALIHKRSDGKIWILDTYPESGLRYVSLDEYLNPKEFKLTRLCILRYKGILDLECIEKFMRQLLQHQNQIAFDNMLIFDNSLLDLNHMTDQSYPLYCTELIYQIIKHCANSTEELYVNDYDRIMHKWDTLSAETKGKTLSPLQFLKLFYLKLNLKRLKESPVKILITPNGMQRSPAFEMIYKVELLEDANDLRKVFIRTPEYSESPPSSAPPT